jgi:hypothetical protein
MTMALHAIVQGLDAPAELLGSALSNEAPAEGASQLWPTL